MMMLYEPPLHDVDPWYRDSSLFTVHCSLLFTVHHSTFLANYCTLSHTLHTSNQNHITSNHTRTHIYWST